MDFLKKHYEKLLLGMVLIGLLLAVAALPFFLSSEQEKLKTVTTTILNPKVKPLTNLDLTVTEATLQRVAAPAVIDFGPPNRLFNPMPWQKGPDGKIHPQEKMGPTRIVVTNITPLYLRLTLDSVTVSDTGAKYVIGVEKQAAPTADKRSKRQTYCTLNPPTKNEFFQVLEVKGKPEEPTEIVVQLKDTSERAVITKEKPFERVDGYMADLRYDVENKRWEKRRVNSQPLSFNGEEYKIVAINQNEVVLSAPNQKKWTIKANPNVAP
jgi:hypothetical protein